MNKCQDILKVVRGNGFTLCLQVEARRTDGTAVEDFALQGDEVLKLLHNGASETKSYETVGNNVFVSFDGDDDLGWYGLEMTGLFHDEPWRWSVPKVFQIVETNERANLPSWTFLADDTYIIGCGITLLSSMVQADWTETNPSNPSYILNKPDLDVYATHAEVAVVNNRIITLDGQVVKTVAQTLSDGEKQRARTNIGTVAKTYVDSGLGTKQDVIADLSTIRTGAADGTVARGYLYDFSEATHTPAAAVGTILAAAATKANAAQPKLTPGTGITIDENNVISASGGGVTEISGLMPIVFGTYNESTGAYDNTYLKEDSSAGASWLYDTAPNIHQELWGGTSEETTFRIPIDIIQGTTDVYGSVLAYITAVSSSTLKVSFSFEGVDYIVLFDVQANHATTTATKLSHLVANEEIDNFYVKPSGGIPSTDLSSAVQTSLGKADTAKQEDNVFWATYGTTTRAEVVAAVTAGKIVACKYGNYVYYCSVINTASTSTNILFESVEGAQVRAVYVNGSNQWGGPMGPTLEQTGNKKATITGNESSTTYYPTTKAVADYAEAKTNKVTSLSDQSTDAQYPSAKAVWDEVGDINEVLDGLNGGDSGAFSNLYKMGVVSQTQTWTQASDGGYDYTMSNPVTGYIPQANIDLFESAGATFNTTTGYFEINGLTDISYKEMMLVYQKNLTDAAKNVSSFFQGGYGKNTGAFNSDVTRTNIATWDGTWNQKLVCTQICMISPLEVFRYASVDNKYMNANCSWAFQGSNHIKALVPLVNVSDVTSFNGTFASLPSFEECQLKGLKIALSIPDSPRFKASAVAYMINNAANTSAITITLHATAYARAIADSDVQAALQAHPTITLASA